MNHMDTQEGSVRKLQYTGKSSYSVNLPKSWVEAAGLHPQDSLVVQEDGEALRIMPLKAGTPPGHQMDLIESGEPVETVARRVVSAYLAGCEVIRVLPKGGRLGVPFKEDLRQKIARRTIGLEVIEDSLKELTFQALVARPRTDIMTLVRRMYFISSNMLQEAVSSLLSGDREEAVSVTGTDDDVDRFHFYSVRILNQAADSASMLKDTGLLYRSEAMMAKTIVKSVERIADHAVSIAEMALAGAALTPEESGLVRDEAGQVSAEYENAISSFFRFDGRRAEEALMEHEGVKAGRERKGPATGLVMEHIWRVSDYAADICEAVVDMTIARSMRREAARQPM